MHGTVGRHGWGKSLSTPHERRLSHAFFCVLQVLAHTEAKSLHTAGEGTKERQIVLFDDASAKLVVPTAINHLLELAISELYLGPSSLFNNSCNDEISGIAVVIYCLKYLLMLPHARIFSLPRYLCTLVVSAAARVPGGDHPASSYYRAHLRTSGAPCLLPSPFSLSLAAPAYQTFGYASCLSTALMAVTVEGG